jgi:tRNA (uracil-5-)-methyltransferase
MGIRCWLVQPKSVRIFSSQVQVQRLGYPRMSTGSTRPRDSGSSPVLTRPEKRPRLELNEQDDELAVNERHTSTIRQDEPPAEGANSLKVTKKNRKRKQKQPAIEPYSSDDVLYHDVVSLLKNSGKTVEAQKEWDAPLPFGSEVELVVSELSSTGMRF